MLCNSKPPATILSSTELTTCSPAIGGVFKLELFLTDDYPMVPPKIRFLTKIYHPNVDKLGRICLDVLKSKDPFSSFPPSKSTLGSISSANKHFHLKTTGPPPCKSEPSCSPSRRSSAPPTRTTPSPPTSPRAGRTTRTRPSRRPRSGPRRTPRPLPARRTRRVGWIVAFRSSGTACATRRKSSIRRSTREHMLRCWCWEEWVARRDVLLIGGYFLSLSLLTYLAWITPAFYAFRDRGGWWNEDMVDIHGALRETE